MTTPFDKFSIDQHTTIMTDTMIIESDAHTIDTATQVPTQKSFEPDRMLLERRQKTLTLLNVIRSLLKLNEDGTCTGVDTPDSASLRQLLTATRVHHDWIPEPGKLYSTSSANKEGNIDPYQKRNQFWRNISSIPPQQTRDTPSISHTSGKHELDLAASALDRHIRTNLSDSLNLQKPFTENLNPLQKLQDVAWSFISRQAFARRHSVRR